MVTVCIFAGGAAERTGERRPPAESRDRDCGIGGAAAIDHEKALRGRFGVGLGKALDPEHFVEHDDAGAQYDGGVSVGARAGGSQPLPPLLFAASQRLLAQFNHNASKSSGAALTQPAYGRHWKRLSIEDSVPESRCAIA